MEVKQRRCRNRGRRGRYFMLAMSKVLVEYQMTKSTITYCFKL